MAALASSGRDYIAAGRSAVVKKRIRYDETRNHHEGQYGGFRKPPHQMIWQLHRAGKEPRTYVRKYVPEENLRRAKASEYLQ